MSNMHTTNNAANHKDLHLVTQLVSEYLKQLRFPFRASMAAVSESAALSFLSFLIKEARKAGREDILHVLEFEGLLYPVSINAKHKAEQQTLAKHGGSNHAQL